MENKNLLDVLYVRDGAAHFRGFQKLGTDVGMRMLPNGVTFSAPQDLPDQPNCHVLRLSEGGVSRDETLLGALRLSGTDRKVYVFCDGVYLPTDIGDGYTLEELLEEEG